MKTTKPSKKLFWYLYLFILIAMTLFLLFNDYGLIKYFSLKNDLKTLNNEIESSENKLKELDEQIEKLQNDLSLIEKVARERYHMLGEHEKAFKLEEN